MPSISAHMAVALKICNNIDVNKEEFIKGNILPDLYDDKEKSHYKIMGTKYEIPDINKACEYLNLSNSLDLGYLSHLLLDKYYFDEYLMKYESDLFNDTLIYKDYDILNKDIIEYFKLDINYLKKVLKNFPNDINKRKLRMIINYLNFKIYDDLNILGKNDFIRFLDEISIKIENELIRRSNDEKY